MARLSIGRPHRQVVANVGRAIGGRTCRGRARRTAQSATSPRSSGAAASPPPRDSDRAWRIHLAVHPPDLPQTCDRRRSWLTKSLNPSPPETRPTGLIRDLRGGPGLDWPAPNHRGARHRQPLLDQVSGASSALCPCNAQLGDEGTHHGRLRRAMSAITRMRFGDPPPRPAASVGPRVGAVAPRAAAAIPAPTRCRFSISAEAQHDGMAQSCPP
jgi:hypothetical protein